MIEFGGIKESSKGQCLVTALGSCIVISLVSKMSNTKARCSVFEKVI